MDHVIELTIYSYILPRLVWCKYKKHATIDKARRRINHEVRSYVVKIGKKAIRHLNCDDHHPALFNDMVHPSFIGLDIFLNALTFLMICCLIQKSDSSRNNYHLWMKKT
jgi:hypothetical protein